MIKVRLIRTNGQCMANKQHKGEFIREFKNTSELAEYLLSTKRVYLVDVRDIEKNKRQSLYNKFKAMKSRNSAFII